LGESADDLVLVFIDTADEVVGYADIERAVPLAG
jgi:hypothetical protein